MSFSDEVTFDEFSLLVFKNDLWRVLFNFKDEIPELIKALEEGKIDGSVYSAACACLIGTIANIKHCSIDDEQFLDIKNCNNPIERWFMMIKPGNTPENNFAAKMAREWINEFVNLKDKNNEARD